jgi:hypothetical protein
VGEPGLQKRKHKYPQHIWLDIDVFRKVLELADKYGVAPNIVCAELIRKAVFEEEEGRAQTKEIVKEVIKLVCPACLEKFDNVTDFRLHIHKNRDHVKSFLEKIV